jgi:glycosyltransferase involved in cell wall biosynthesis
VISVIIATHNRRRLLARTLDALHAQEWPADELEILVVDNGSSDGTPHWIASRRSVGAWPRVTLLDEARPGKSHAVNHGVTRAVGSLLLFTDDDVVPDPGWVRAMAGAMAASGADFGVGRIRPLWEAPCPTWLSPALHGVLAIPDNGPIPLRIARGSNEHIMPIGTNMALRPAVVRTIGGWHSELGKLRGTLRSGEDHEFYLRMLAAGFEGVYEPTASVAHLVPAERLSRRYFTRWMRENGRIVAALDRQYPLLVRRVAGVPAYLWREALSDAGRVLVPPTSPGAAARFTALARLAWFAGYLGGAWQGNHATLGAEGGTSATPAESPRLLQER